MQLLPLSNLFEIITPEEALKKLEPLKIVGLDTETMGFDPYTKQLMLLQLGCYDFQVVIDCTTIDPRYFKEYLQSDRLFIGWNIKFDMKFLFHKKIVLKNVYDGFIAEKLMWLGYPSGIHSMSLKSAGENYLGVELDKSIRGKIMWAGLSDDVIEYAANDVKYLEKIKDVQAIELEKKQLTTANVYEQKSVPWVAYTEYCGVLINVPRWKCKMTLDNFTEHVFEKALNDWVVASATGEKFAYWYIQTEGLSEKDLAKARKKMKGERCPEKDIKGDIRGYAEAYKVPVEHKVDEKFINRTLPGDLFFGYLPSTCVINWKSSKQVIPLFKSLGLNLLTKDKETGELKDSIEEKVIAPQAHLSTLVYLYIEYQGARKLTSTYGQNVLDQINEVSKRVHTNFNQLGTDTGKNLSNIWLIQISFIEQINDFLIKEGTPPIIYKEKSYYTIHLGRLEDIFLVYSNIYKPNLYFLKRKYKKFCPLVEKFTRNHSVNSVKGKENHKTEPSPEWEGAETRNGVPKQE